MGFKWNENLRKLKGASFLLSLVLGKATCFLDLVCAKEVV